jgi:hypothetical protein
MERQRENRGPRRLFARGQVRQRVGCARLLLAVAVVSPALVVSACGGDEGAATPSFAFADAVPGGGDAGAASAGEGGSGGAALAGGGGTKTVGGSGGAGAKNPGGGGAPNAAGSGGEAGLSTGGTAGAGTAGSAGEGQGGTAGVAAGAAGSTDPGTSGAAGSGGAAGTANPPKDPLPVSTDKGWEWLEIPGMKCGDGSTTGIGVSKSSKSNKLLVYMEGGGACWDETSCTVPTATFLSGFGEVAFDVAVKARGGIFNRFNGDNPFRDYSFVYVPYCTGDVHAGSKDQGVAGVHFVGFDNMGLALERIVPTFPAQDRVVLTGTSAGGFGALLNYHRTAVAFDKTPVHLLDDSGPPLTPKYFTPDRQQLMLGAWDAEQNFPHDICPQAKIGAVHEVYGCLATTYPERRFGLVTSRWDAVIRTFFGVYSPLEYAKGIDAVTDLLDGYDAWSYFTIVGDKHTWLLDEPVGKFVYSDGRSLENWLKSFESGKGFTSVKPF